MRRVVSVQVGLSQTVTWLGREVRTSIVKAPVSGPVGVGPEGLDGDSQSDRTNHGGADKAVYAYAAEDLRWWAGELGRPMECGMFGENLTTEGIELQESVIGEIWRIGTAVLQVSEPRTPCWKLGLRLQDPAFPRRFAKARRTGVLLRVLCPGALAAGDVIGIDDRPEHGVTTSMINEMYYGRGSDLTPIYAAPELAAHWRRWADHRTVWHLHDEKEKGIRVDG